MSDSVWPHRPQPTRLPGPWDPPGKNTGVGCHFLLQCMKVKSESEVAQSCPTLSGPMDCSLPGSSVHWIFQARVLEWGQWRLNLFNFFFVCLFAQIMEILYWWGSFLKRFYYCYCKVAPDVSDLWDSMECSLSGSSVRGIFQARILECPPPGDLLDPGIKHTSLCLLHW